MTAFSSRDCRAIEADEGSSRVCWLFSLPMLALAGGDVASIGAAPNRAISSFVVRGGWLLGRLAVAAISTECDGRSAEDRNSVGSAPLLP